MGGRVRFQMICRTMSFILRVYDDESIPQWRRVIQDKRSSSLLLFSPISSHLISLQDGHFTKRRTRGRRDTTINSGSLWCLSAWIKASVQARAKWFRNVDGQIPAWRVNHMTNQWLAETCNDWHFRLADPNRWTWLETWRLDSVEIFIWEIKYRLI